MKMKKVKSEKWTYETKDHENGDKKITVQTTTRHDNINGDIIRTEETFENSQKISQEQFKNNNLFSSVKYECERVSNEERYVYIDKVSFSVLNGNTNKWENRIHIHERIGNYKFGTLVINNYDVICGSDEKINVVKEVYKGFFSNVINLDKDGEVDFGTIELVYRQMAQGDDIVSTRYHYVDSDCGRYVCHVSYSHKLSGIKNERFITRFPCDFLKDDETGYIEVSYNSATNATTIVTKITKKDDLNCEKRYSSRTRINNKKGKGGLSSDTALVRNKYEETMIDSHYKVFVDSSYHKTDFSESKRLTKSQIIKDQENNRIDQKIISSDKATLVTKYEYNDHKNTTLPTRKTITVFPEGKVKEKTDLEYFENGAIKSIRTSLLFGDSNIEVVETDKYCLINGNICQILRDETRRLIDADELIFHSISISKYDDNGIDIIEKDYEVYAGESGDEDEE
jgi:hypothetical protein